MRSSEQPDRLGGPERDDYPIALIWAGYLCAVLVPPVGLVIGIVLLAKDQANNGAWVMVMSVAALLAWLSIFAFSPTAN